MTCSNCGTKISRADKLKKGLIERSAVQFSSQFKQEYEDRREWCLKCLLKFFKPRFKEATSQLKDKAIPDKFKNLLKKGEKLSK